LKIVRDSQQQLRNPTSQSAKAFACQHPVPCLVENIHIAVDKIAVNKDKAEKKKNNKKSKDPHRAKKDNNLPKDPREREDAILTVMDKLTIMHFLAQ